MAVGAGRLTERFLKHDPPTEKELAALVSHARQKLAPATRRLAGVTVAEGRVWLVLENGEVLALDAVSGKVAGRFGDLQLNLNGVGLAQRPAPIGGRIIIPIGGALLGINPPSDDSDE